TFRQRGRRSTCSPSGGGPTRMVGLLHRTSAMVAARPFEGRARGVGSVRLMPSGWTENRSIDIERNIAQCRVVLSVAAFITVYIDPTRPTLTRWLPLTGGPFTLYSWALAGMLSHLAYSVAIYLIVGRKLR